MKTTVIFHRADFDGIFCREIARKFLGNEGVDFIGWNHGDPYVKMPQEGLVYILDLSPDCLDASAVETTIWNRIVWIDHHKSSIDKFQPPRFPPMAGYRIDGVAACRLVWQWFTQEGWHTHRNVPLPDKQAFIDRTVSEPLAVRLAGEYDIWDKRDERAELFQHGLRSRELNDITWKYLLGEDQVAGAHCVSDLLEGGKILQFARTKENASIIQELGFTFQWEGLTWLACNHARYNSHLFTAGLKPEHDALFGFKWTGKCWSVSLYHAPGREHHDLSKIAVNYGGGGHRGACGFQTAKLPFIA